METDDPSWGDLIARASVRSLPQKLRAGFPRKKGGGGADDGYTPSGAAEAAVEKLVQQARNERIKAESALIDLEAKRGAYVERERMEWLLSFIQRGIADGLAQIRKKLKDDEKIAAFCAEMEEVMMRMAAMLEKEGADGE